MRFFGPAAGMVSSLTAGFIHHGAEHFGDMEVIEGDFFYRVGQVDPGCADIGRVHIHRQGFDGFNLAVTQVSEVTRQTFNTAIIPEFQRLAPVYPEMTVTY
ncbi:Uncharacterised protein [Klebsiella pneumoniae]|uniref:Uncharacterized protein n=1 Tax=Klebsiella pneumoniae TaxID=573 RepID=A0A378H3I7_KLEPN|nr:Uncharacterised protein [Klebsiella pneumoniae]